MSKFVGSMVFDKSLIIGIKGEQRGMTVDVKKVVNGRRIVT